MSTAVDDDLDESLPDYDHLLRPPNFSFQQKSQQVQNIVNSGKKRARDEEARGQRAQATRTQNKDDEELDEQEDAEKKLFVSEELLANAMEGEAEEEPDSYEHGVLQGVPLLSFDIRLGSAADPPPTGCANADLLASGTRTLLFVAIAWPKG
eukprot:gene14331-20319_t